MLDNVDFITKYFLHQQHLSSCGELVVVTFNYK